MSATTLRELEALEQLQHDTGLTGKTLQDAFNARDTRPVSLYEPKAGSLRRFFTNIYNTIQDSRERRRDLHEDGYPGVEPLPSFREWLGEDVYKMLED